VVPTVASNEGTLRHRVAVAVLESRLGSGSRRSVYFPGNVRPVSDYPAADVVVRRADYVAATDARVDDQRLVSWLAERRKGTIYTPDSSISAAPPPLVRPHLLATAAHGRAHGAAARRTRGASLSVASAVSLAPALAAIAGVGLVLAGGAARKVGLALLLAYALALLASGVHASLRFRSLAVGLFQPAAVVASQVAYLAGFVRGLIEPTRPVGRADARAAPPSQTA
jgi:hypothetical protein